MSLNPKIKQNRQKLPREEVVQFINHDLLKGCFFSQKKLIFSSMYLLNSHNRYRLQLFVMSGSKLVFIFLLIAFAASDVIDFADLLDQATQTVTPSTPIRCPAGYVYIVDLNKCVCPGNLVPDQNGNCVQPPKSQPQSQPQNQPQPTCTQNCGSSTTVKDEKELKDIFIKPAPIQRGGLTICAACTIAPQIFVPYSDTNNQVEGVDEADIIKNDGTYIYSISNNILSIIQAYPINYLRISSTINLNVRNYQASNLFINGNYMIIIGEKPSVPNPYTIFGLYDITNKACPTLVTEEFIQGSYLEARMIDDTFYILSKHKFVDRYSPAPYYSFGNTPNLPFSKIYYYSGDYTEPVFVNIASANPIKRWINAISIITEDSQTLYMSKNHIYFIFDKIVANEDFSHIHKVFVSDTLMVPVADTRVSGVARNQFYFDEDDKGYLRVFTSNKQGVKSNNIYNLDPYLNSVSQIKEFASNYEITTVRFVGNRAYIVLFGDQTPYIVVQFINYNPTILGYFTLSGFSTYLHPYDETTIISIGKDVSPYGQLLGLRVALYDVTNPIYPYLLAEKTIAQETSTSLALIEHKAFLFNKQRNYLVLPLTITEPNLTFYGALPLTFTKSYISVWPPINHGQASVERSLWISNLLYTKSQCLLKVNEDLRFSFQRQINIPCTEGQLLANNFCSQNPGFADFIKNLPSY